MPAFCCSTRCNYKLRPEEMRPPCIGQCSTGSGDLASKGGGDSSPLFEADQRFLFFLIKS